MFGTELPGGILSTSTFLSVRNSENFGRQYSRQADNLWKGQVGLVVGDGGEPENKITWWRFGIVSQKNKTSNAKLQQSLRCPATLL